MSLLSRLFPYKVISNNFASVIANSRGSIATNFPADFTENEITLINEVQKKTMTSVERLVSLIRSVDYIVANNIEGDIVECGVWRGGSMALVARRLLQLNTASRHLYLFDTFEGMSKPGENDVDAVKNRSANELLAETEQADGNNIWCVASLEDVRRNITETFYPQDKVSYVAGKVEDTLPHEPIQKIAILRLDTDWYESTLHELETLYDKVVPGGMIIIDDYGHWKGCQKAVDEFISRRKLNVFLNRIDYTARSFIKHDA